MNKLPIALFFVSCFALAAGCSSPVAPGAQVAGTVTLDGQPVSGARVVFYKDGSNGTEKITANTDMGGKFDFSGGDVANRAVPPGKYKVTVYKLEVSGKNAILPEDVDLEQIEASGLGKNVLPSIYATPNTTPQTADVVEGPNTVDILLKGKGK